MEGWKTDATERVPPREQPMKGHGPSWSPPWRAMLRHGRGWLMRWWHTQNRKARRRTRRSASLHGLGENGRDGARPSKRRGTFQGIHPCQRSDNSRHCRAERGYAQRVRYAPFPGKGPSSASGPNGSILRGKCGLLSSLKRWLFPAHSPGRKV